MYLFRIENHIMLLTLLIHKKVFLNHLVLLIRYFHHNLNHHLFDLHPLNHHLFDLHPLNHHLFDHHQLNHHLFDHHQLNHHLFHYHQVNHHLLDHHQFNHHQLNQFIKKYHLKLKYVYSSSKTASKTFFFIYCYEFLETIINGKKKKSILISSSR